jgi:Coenzyme PQQ synthesis protein D (PqqD)
MTCGPLPPDASLRVPDDTMWQEVEGQVVLLSLADESYFRLDRVGSRIWVAVVEQGSLEAAVAALSGVFDVEDEVLRADATRLASELIEAGLLEVEPPPAGGPLKPTVG